MNTGPEGALHYINIVLNSIVNSILCTPVCCHSAHDIAAESAGRVFVNKKVSVVDGIHL